MPISPNQPPADNSALCEELFTAGSILFISAHPDDIEFYCGGLVHMLRQRGVRVIFAIATRGGKGCTGRRKQRLEGLRTRHQMDSAAILGGAEIVLYDYPDKELPRYIEPFAEDLKSLIAREKPDIVFSWDPDFIYNPHPDHQAAADAARLASDRSEVGYYGTREPNLWVGFDEDVYRVKLKSLKAHRTETPWYFFDLLMKRRFMRKLRGEGAKVGAKYAEVLRRP